MAYQIEMTIVGAKQGKFQGSAGTGKRWKIPCLAFSYSVETPVDQKTGQATGKRQHGTIRIVKEWGAASPQLLQALSANEVLKEVTIEIAKTETNGWEHVCSTVKLSNAAIAKLRPKPGKGRREEVWIHSNEIEEFGIVFQKIEVSDVNAKTSATDDWEAGS